MSYKVVIAAGGTGGHVFPGIAIADALVRMGPYEPVFVGTAKGFEKARATAAGYPVELFDVTAIKGGGPVQAIRGGVVAALAMKRALGFVKDLAPRVVVSIGGYAAGPVSLAARMRHVPLALVEPNSVMGLSNRILAPVARSIYLAFDEARPSVGRAEARVTGVPIRSGFQARPKTESSVARVLVLGGSQGAKALNDRLPDALGRVAGERGGLEVLHQAGEGKVEDVRAAYGRVGLPGARVVAFSDAPADDLAWADLVVARAGAGTIAEIAAIGRPSLLIPFPAAADDHQARNAAAYAAKGAALWVRQEAADSTRLAMEIGRLLGDAAELGRLAEAARGQGRPEAAEAIARDLVTLMEAG